VLSAIRSRGHMSRGIFLWLINKNNINTTNPKGYP
jgi:hypothetical protein